MRPNDADLLRYSSEGDVEAFRMLFQLKHRFVYRIAYQILGDRSAAEDAVQETFLTLWRKADQHVAGRPVDPWLRRIVTNKAIDLWRARDREPGPSGDAQAPDAESVADRGSPARSPAPGTDDPTLTARIESLQRVWNDIAGTLPAQQRAAFYLREIEEVDTAEVAEALGCSASAVRSHVALARKRLQQEIRERYPELLRGRRSPPAC